MPGPPVENIHANDPGLFTDYDPAHGSCACHNQPVNSFGRCLPLNAAAHILPPLPSTPVSGTIDAPTSKGKANGST